MAERELLVGKIVSIHGNKGNLKVHSYAESLSVFSSGYPVLIKHESGRLSTHEIRRARFQKRSVVLSIKGVVTVCQARELVGAEIHIDSDLLPELDEGTYYWFDIIGLSVFALDRTYLGCIESIIPTDGNDVYVARNQGNEVLIPALESVVLDIDLKRKTMRVDLPEGII